MGMGTDAGIYPHRESPRQLSRMVQFGMTPIQAIRAATINAATLLKENGYDVIWDDAIAESLTYAEWLQRVRRERPDIIALETSVDKLTDCHYLTC